MNAVVKYLFKVNKYNIKTTLERMSDKFTIMIYILYTEEMRIIRGYEI